MFLKPASLDEELYDNIVVLVVLAPSSDLTVQSLFYHVC